MTPSKQSISPLTEFGREKSIALLQRMMEIRAFELKAEELFGLGKVHGTMHLSIGQEASAVGANAALRETDYLLNSHRGHGHCLAWGSDLNGMMAEFMGKETGRLPRPRRFDAHRQDVHNVSAPRLLDAGRGLGRSDVAAATGRVRTSLFPGKNIHVV